MLPAIIGTEEKALVMNILANTTWLQIKGDGSKHRHWNRL